MIWNHHKIWSKTHQKDIKLLMKNQPKNRSTNDLKINIKYIPHVYPLGRPFWVHFGSLWDPFGGPWAPKIGPKGVSNIDQGHLFFDADAKMSRIWKISILDLLGMHFGTLWGPFWDPLGSILGSVWSLWGLFKQLWGPTLPARPGGMRAAIK